MYQAQSSFTTQKGETHQSQKQGNNFKASSSKSTKKDENETALKGLMEVMKQFTESHDKRMTSLIDKPEELDLSAILNKRVKKRTEITKYIKRMKCFLSISELDRHKDGVQEIERTKAQEVANDMSMEFPIIFVDEDDALAEREDQIAQEEPSVSTGAIQSSKSSF
ncbi:hypothetical protein H5410_028389 [Solanum commersonii]|uniref:Uncharacterized protein n=1 Tax=Solanum commersonii TaxID=4109 RepID=A0A9J5Z1Y5_SOLCO|nr:hypothetical protein H5410_028389 [Solanum commersonii]